MTSKISAAPVAPPPAAAARARDAHALDARARDAHALDAAPRAGALAIARADVEAAAARIAPYAARTPLLESELLNEAAGRRVLVKAECLQRTGSFKFRGACNAVAQLDAAARGRGVIAFSSGNHAQGVACAARLFGAPATILMPSDAPALKIANVRALGAKLVLYDRRREDREDMSARIAAETGAILIRPFDDAAVIAGQGTTGLEIAEDCAAREIAPEVVVAPAGGGGLAAGIAVAMEAGAAGPRVMTAEPAGFDDIARSYASGAREVNAPGGASICDALMSHSPGELTFPILLAHGAAGAAVDDDAARAAMRLMFERLKLVAEPGGAVALAAVMDGRIPGTGPVVVVASGGNVDAAAFAAALTA